MHISRGLTPDAFCRGGFLSIGNFDGVHRGHQRMLHTLVERARTVGGPAVVFTFDPHPIQVLRPDQAPPSLTTLDDKLALLAAAGVDATFIYSTRDGDLLRLPAEQFFDEMVCRAFQARGLVEGPNFCFGRNRGGTVETLRALCERARLSCDIVEPVIVGDRIVSSSEVRRLLNEGEVATAAEWLGHPHVVTGTVATGARRGGSLGFPTANLSRLGVLVPADGVYAAIVHEAGPCGGQAHWAAVHVGSNPTFSEAERKLEVHLLDFTGDLYGRTLRVEFRHRLRGTVRFDGPQALIAQLKQDVAAVRSLRDGTGVR